jgi:hypothetical protein
MAKQIVLGGVIGAVVVFLMSMIFHMVTNLGETGVKPLPNEDSVLSMMRSSIPDSGLYVFPAANMAEMKTDAEKAAYAQKYKIGPTGILVYKTGGTEFSFPKLLVNQFLFGLVAALLVAWILAITASATTYGSRVLIVFLAAVFGAFVYTLPYWNWYGFPSAYILGELGTWAASWLVGGLAMAAIVKQKPSAGVAEPAMASRA